MNGIITAQQRFLFPDSPLGKMPEQIRAVSAKNGKTGIQLCFECGVPNPFEATSAKNWTGIGTNFPCGDAFIVYPGDKGPWPSMRLEAERMGAQEAALLCALRKKDAAAHDALVARVFTSFCEYNNDPTALDAAHEELLRLLS